MLVAQLRILFQSFADDAIELRRQVRIHARRRRRLALQDRCENDARRIPCKSLPARRHLVQHQSQRKQIGASIELFRAHLLGRHIADGADRHSRAGEIRIAIERRAAYRDRFAHSARDHLFREAEIEHFGLPALGDKNIGRLDVAMNNSLGVRCLQGVGHINANFQQTIE